MLPNFAVLPPEVNSARVFAGAGCADVSGSGRLG